MVVLALRGCADLGFVVASLAAIVCAIACPTRETRQYQKAHDKRIVVRNFSDGRFEYVEVDGHEYMLWSRGGVGGITHSPKCRCIQKDTPHEQRAD